MRLPAACLCLSLCLSLSLPLVARGLCGRAGLTQSFLEPEDLELFEPDEVSLPPEDLRL